MLRPGQVLSSSAGRMWSVLGGFIDGLTGAGVGALWDGGHCSCELGYRTCLALRRKPVPVQRIIRVWLLECLSVSCVKFSQTARTLDSASSVMVIADVLQWRL